VRAALVAAGGEGSNGPGYPAHGGAARSGPAVYATLSARDRSAGTLGFQVASGSPSKT
jgi:hypothetical protein